jgi:hypothetical protein
VANRAQPGRCRSRPRKRSMASCWEPSLLRGSVEGVEVNDAIVSQDGPSEGFSRIGRGSYGLVGHGADSRRYAGRRVNSHRETGPGEIARGEHAAYHSVARSDTPMQVNRSVTPSRSFIASEGNLANSTMRPTAKYGTTDSGFPKGK